MIRSNRMRPAHRSFGLGVVLLALAGGGCAGLEPPPQNLVTGEGQLMHAEWTLDVPQPNAPRVYGYIVNTYYYFATQVQVLVEALDAQGQLVERRFQWVPGSVPPSNRVYFEVRNLPVADQYRVT